jgi:hypothetical protein
MKKLIIKIYLIFSMVFLGACGFEPLNSSLNINKITISEKSFSGNKKINRKIFNKLNLKVGDDISAHKLKLGSESIITTLVKDTSGNATTYKTTLLIDVALIRNEKIIKNKRFEKSITYPNLSNKFELSKYQTEVEKNLINSATQEIKMFLGS